MKRVSRKLTLYYSVNDFLTPLRTSYFFLFLFFCLPLWFLGFVVPLLLCFGGSGFFTVTL